MLEKVYIFGFAVNTNNLKVMKQRLITKSNK